MKVCVTNLRIQRRSSGPSHCEFELVEEGGKYPLPSFIRGVAYFFNVSDVSDTTSIAM